MDDEQAWSALMCSNSPDFLVVVDRERRFRWVNRLHQGLTLQDVIGQPLEAFEHPDTHEISQQATAMAFETGERQVFESHATLPDGADAWYRVRCIPIADRPDRLLLVTTDISDQKRAEHERDAYQQQLFLSQKMEALGRLAGGVAHDFNNLLTPIVGFAEIVQGMLDDAHPAQEALAGIGEAASRAAELTNELLTVGSSRSRRLERVDLAQVFRGMERVVRRVLPRSIELDTSGVVEGAVVWADSGQLGQVLLNLVLNAADAMPGGGLLEIRTWVDGATAVLSVRDTGEGMTTETAQRVFEPFFTTKGTSGTGLGLATAHGIVEQSGGRFEVESQLGEGTTFRVLLPVASSARESGTAAP